MIRKILAGLVLATLIGGICGVLSCGGTQTPTPEEKPVVEERVKEPSAGVIEITAVELISDYHANEISADQKYLNKILRVTGKVKAIERYMGGEEPCVRLYGVIGNTVYWVLCVFKSEAEAASVSKSQEITVEGKCVGLIGGSSPTLRNCSLVE